MRRLLLLGLCCSLQADERRAPEPGLELHVSRISMSPDNVTMRFLPDGTPFRLEAALDEFLPAIAIPPFARARINVVPAGPDQPLVKPVDIALPASGRYLLLLHQASPERFQATMVPTDTTNLPLGGVVFLNLSSRRIRCQLDGESVEVASGEQRLMPKVSAARRIVNYRVELQAKANWTVDKASTLILGAGRRHLFVLTEDSATSPLRHEHVTDFDPSRNMAPVVATVPSAAVEPPVTAVPPPADQPAK